MPPVTVPPHHDHDLRRAADPGPDRAATPYESAVDVAHSLTSGALLTVDLEGHVALGDSDCADERATRYLVDLIVPEPGARC